MKPVPRAHSKQGRNNVTAHVRHLSFISIDCLTHALTDDPTMPGSAPTNAWPDNWLSAAGLPCGGPCFPSRHCSPRRVNLQHQIFGNRNLLKRNKSDAPIVLAVSYCRPRFD
jgi:hypothetical protein